MTGWLCSMVGVGFVGLIFMLSYVLGARLIEAHREVWSDVAAKLGLTAKLSGSYRDWRLRGMVSGHRLEVSYVEIEHGDSPMCLEVWYPPKLLGLACLEPSMLEAVKERLSPDVQLGIPDLDRNFRIRSAAPTLLQALFVDASVVSGFRTTAGQLGESSVKRLFELRVKDSKNNNNLEEIIVESISLINLLADALDRFSDTLASRTQLVIVPEVARNLPRFEGTRDGVHIDLRQPDTGDGLQLTATPASSVEPTLTIVAKQADDASLTGDRVPMLDPILDAHVHVSTEQPEATRALLTRDQTREDILALMMAHPNARVHHGTVTLLVPTVDPDTVAAALDDVVALAASLSTPRAGEVSRAGAAAVAKTTR